MWPKPGAPVGVLKFGPFWYPLLLHGQLQPHPRQGLTGATEDEIQDDQDDIDNQDADEDIQYEDKDTQDEDEDTLAMATS